LLTHCFSQSVHILVRHRWLFAPRLYVLPWFCFLNRYHFRRTKSDISIETRTMIKVFDRLLRCAFGQLIRNHGDWEFFRLRVGETKDDTRMNVNIPLQWK
jgi:hypothetical protein